MKSLWYLMIAIPFGVLGTISMKLSQGLKKWKPSVCLAIFSVISFVALTFAIRGMDVSLAYAIWSGMGTILIAILGVFLFNESISFLKIISIMCIVIGVMGIHLANAIH